MATPESISFENLVKKDDNTYSFTLNNSHVTYANTLRRLILTGVETVAFRADMTSSGTTTDVLVSANTTPMTNEMLAHRIGLLPLNVKDPLKWNPDRYVFRLEGNAKKDSIVDLCAGDFKIFDRSAKRGGAQLQGGTQLQGGAGSNSENSSSEESLNTTNSTELSSLSSLNTSASGSSSEATSASSASEASSATSASSVASLKNASAETLDASVVPTSLFFPPHPVTGDTCLIATFPAGSGQKIDLVAKATIGTGRENARFMPVSQCSYEYTRDTDPDRQQELFEKWLLDAKKVVYSPEEADSDKIKALRREYNTMEVARCFLRNETTGEPYSFDFTVESIGILNVPYIVKRACEVGRNMVGRYVNVEKGKLPDELTVEPAEGRIIGFDFLFRGHDHTLGNLLQTYLVEHHVDGTANPKITFAGYKVPHPLRDEMVLRIGVEDGQEATARLALAMACRGCVNIFDEMLRSWIATATGRKVATTSNVVSAARAALRKADVVGKDE